MILYKKISIKAQKGTGTKHIYNTLDDISKDPKYSKIKRLASSGTTRCVGAAHDASKICGIDYRSMVSRGYDKSFRLAGENDDIVDAWNWKDAANNTDEIDVIYDREKHDPKVLDKLLKDLPLNSFIGTGDARGRYISKKNKLRSRHGITVLGYLPNGAPIVYDLTKFKEGIPAKYKGKINYIAVPKGGKNTTFSTLLPSTEHKASAGVPEKEIITPDVVKAKPEIILDKVKPTDYFGGFMTLLKDTFNIS